MDLLVKIKIVRYSFKFKLKTALESKREDEIAVSTAVFMASSVCYGCGTAALALISAKNCSRSLTASL
jgi:hypothetical protein